MIYVHHFNSTCDASFLLEFGPRSAIMSTMRLAFALGLLCVISTIANAFVIPAAKSSSLVNRQYHARYGQQRGIINLDKLAKNR